MVTKTDGSEDETEKLKAKVAELEAALKRERKKLREDTTGDMREAMNKATDEYAKFFRGLTMAYFDGLRLAAETAASFAREMGETSKRETSKRKEGGVADESVNSVMDQARDIGTNCTSAYTDALNRMMDIPRQAVDTFYDNYRESSAS